MELNSDSLNSEFSLLNCLPHSDVLSFQHPFLKKKKSIDFREGRERETLICCFTYLSIHWLILVCAPTGDRTLKLGYMGWSSNQLTCPARAGSLLSYSLFSFPILWSYGSDLHCLSDWLLAPAFSVFPIISCSTLDTQFLLPQRNLSPNANTRKHETWALYWSLSHGY